MNPPHVPSLPCPSRWLALVVAWLLWCAPLSAAGATHREPVVLRASVDSMIWPGLLLLAGLLFWLRWQETRSDDNREPLPKPPLSGPFSHEQITHTFISSLPTLSRELNLEVASARQTELIEVSENKTVLGLNLGTNTGQIRVGVTYRYHLRLPDPWRLEIQGQTVVVHAPALRPSLPPAIHTDEMVVQQTRGWLRLPSSELLEGLQHNLTPILTGYASDPRRLELVRETARQSVTDFVQHWLEREAQWRPGRITAIAVHFADEPVLSASPVVRRLPES